MAKWNAKAAGKTTFAVNKFSDWTSKEKASMLGKVSNPTAEVQQKNVGSFFAMPQERDTQTTYVYQTLHS